MLDYELLDFGQGKKLERFGSFVLERPEKTALQPATQSPKIWQADARCEALAHNRYQWHCIEDFKQPWNISYGALKFEVRATISNNVGIFPEQAANWQWLDKQLKKPCRVLNLFAYTGAATLVAARKGALVCHVDASKSTVAWAKKNQQLSGLEQAPIRWIVDDAREFVRRETKRNSQYDALILDPPAFGTSKSGSFAFKQDIGELLQQCRAILTAQPHFIIFNCYATGVKPAQAVEMLAQVFPHMKMSGGELNLKSTDERILSCSTYVRARSII